MDILKKVFLGNFPSLCYSKPKILLTQKFYWYYLAFLADLKKIILGIFFCCVQF
jgi:hypothetical protein